MAGQLEMCQEYAQERGYIIVDKLAEDDRGASGAEIDLPQLNRAREMAVEGEFDTLVVREIDRLSRNLAKQLIVEQELRRAGVSIEYVLGEYADTPEGDLLKHVKAVIAEYERAKIVERNIRGRRLQVKAGNVLVSGRPPYGYRVADVKENEIVIHNLDGTQRSELRKPNDGLQTGRRTLVVFEPEALIVRLVYKWYTRGDNEKRLGTWAIARRLSEMGVPTRADMCPNMAKKSKHGSWSAGSVGGMLRSTTYKGEWSWGKRDRSKNSKPRETWLMVQVPAIIDSETWERARKVAAENFRGARRNTRHKYLLRRRLTCGDCGSSMSCESRCSGKGRRVRLYYRCVTISHRQYGSARVCGMRKNFRADRVDAAVWMGTNFFNRSCGTG